MKKTKCPLCGNDKPPEQYMCEDCEDWDGTDDHWLFNDPSVASLSEDVPDEPDDAYHGDMWRDDV